MIILYAEKHFFLIGFVDTFFFIVASNTIRDVFRSDRFSITSIQIGVKIRDIRPIYLRVHRVADSIVPDDFSILQRSYPKMFRQRFEASIVSFKVRHRSLVNGLHIYCPDFLIDVVVLFFVKSANSASFLKIFFIVGNNQIFHDKACLVRMNVPWSFLFEVAIHAVAAVEEFAYVAPYVMIE